MLVVPFSSYLISAERTIFWSLVVGTHVAGYAIEATSMAAAPDSLCFVQEPQAN